MLTAVSFLCTAAVVPSLPPQGQLAYGALGRGEARIPPGEWYRDYTPGRDAYSHRVLWYDAGPSVANAREADVVFFGDSRMLFALPPWVARSFFRSRDLRWFQLGLAYGERSTFATALLERHGIAPRLAVVDAGQFFDPGISWLGATLVREAGSWGEQRETFETRAGYQFDRWARPIFPHVLPMLFDRGSERGLLDLLRSADDGSWLVRRYRDESEPLVEQAPSSSPLDPRPALAFREAVERGGGRLVLTDVPGDVANRPRAQALAEFLEVPFVAPRVRGLTSGDGVHLDRPSARRFAAALLAGLEAAEVLPVPCRAASDDRSCDR